jgi:hypothetical protein
VKSSVASKDRLVVNTELSEYPVDGLNKDELENDELNEKSLLRLIMTEGVKLEVSTRVRLSLNDELKE